MGNPDDVSIFPYCRWWIGPTLLGLVAIEVAVVDDTKGFTYRNGCDTDDRLQCVRMAVCSILGRSYLYAE